MLDLPRGAKMAPPAPNGLPPGYIRRLKEAYKARREAGVWPTKKNGELTQSGREAAFDWVVGACAALDVLGYNAPTGLAFLSAVRGADDIMLKEVA